ncbi:hypothetical protein NX86_08180 [Streptococcus phocae subsp. salmonis]|uniref:hypothetical protein n=1 Tax=Streptococcus phocae TaxID=119224 RepID=UPI000531180E|nr:hypothetical protein [Streptococcus phocae]KGR72105.1 hypothetical protein NX86_08180 [Streptococcus phocae subsp. salmonis]
MRIVKHYDALLIDIANDIDSETDVMKKLTLRRAMRIDYIIKTFNKLFEEWNAEAETKTSLNFCQVLPTITSIKYPSNIELPPQNQSSEEEMWKNALSTALKPVLEGLKKIMKKKYLRMKLLNILVL